MSVGSKLAGLIFGLTITMIIVLLLLTSKTFLQLFRVEPFFEIDPKIEVSSLISTVLVFLVWERLRDSLSKKLEHLHETLVLRLYRMITGRQFIRLDPEVIKKNRDDVSSYGKFLGIISLYLGKALEKTDDFISALKDFRGNLKEICDLTGIKMKQKTRMETLLYRYGLSH